MVDTNLNTKKPVVGRREERGRRREIRGKERRGRHGAPLHVLSRRVRKHQRNFGRQNLVGLVYGILGDMGGGEGGASSMRKYSMMRYSNFMVT